jgi:hypothetical protein
MTFALKPDQHADAQCGSGAGQVEGVRHPYLPVRIKPVQNLWCPLARRRLARDEASSRACRRCTKLRLRLAGEVHEPGVHMHCPAQRRLLLRDGDQHPWPR